MSSTTRAKQDAFSSPKMFTVTPIDLKKSHNNELRPRETVTFPLCLYFPFFHASFSHMKQPQAFNEQPRRSMITYADARLVNFPSAPPPTLSKHLEACSCLHCAPV